jgi:hypothetical protein
VGRLGVIGVAPDLGSRVSRTPPMKKARVREPFFEWS